MRLIFPRFNGPIYCQKENCKDWTNDVKRLFTVVTIRISTGQYQFSSGLLGRSWKHRNILYICSTTMGLLQKDLFKGKWKYCHAAYHTMLAFLFFTRSCCVRLLSLSPPQSPRIAMPESGGWGGALEYFLGRYVPLGTPNCHPVLKKISPKIDTPF